MLSCPQSIGGLALLLTRALSFFHGGIHPRLQVAHSPLCEIATTSPNGVTRFCNGLRSRRILAGRASADVGCLDDHLPPPNQPSTISTATHSGSPAAAARRAPCGRVKPAPL